MGAGFEFDLAVIAGVDDVVYLRDGKYKNFGGGGDEWKWKVDGG